MDMNAKQINFQQLKEFHKLNGIVDVAIVIVIPFRICVQVHSVYVKIPQSSCQAHMLFSPEFFMGNNLDRAIYVRVCLQ